MRRGSGWAENMNLTTEQRAKNRLEAPELLRAAGITFESRDRGVRLLIKLENTHIDFWPGAGLWIVHGQPIRQRGIDRLIRYIKEGRFNFEEKGEVDSLKVSANF